MAVNYGFNNVWFITPIPVGAKLRADAVMQEVSALESAVQATPATTVEIDGAPRPAAVIESIVRYVC